MEMTPRLRQAVKDYKNGKAESSEILYRESEKYIYTCIYKVMSGNNNAMDITEEIMQETFLEIFLSISQLENEDKFLSWAGTIANRKCFAYIKKNKKYVLLNEEDDTFENLSDSDDIIPEEVMQNLEKRKLVRKIIDTQLTEVQKICIYEYYYNDRKQTEIAELYEMPLNTVKTNLSRAKAKIEEGVLDLEKRDGIRLHSFAPFFVLLFTEDVMAATVPAEVGVSVMATVADTTSKAVSTGTSASVSGATTSTASTVGASSVTTTSVATKVGLIGKIAATSAKAKIIMAVATVSVVGTVGGGAMIASQNGFFTDAPIINEQQENGDNQETGENQDSGDAQEVEENSSETDEQAETESIIDESFYTEYYEPIHFRVAYLPEELISGEDRGNNNFFGRRYVKELEDGTWDIFYIRVWDEGEIATSRIDLKNMGDGQIGAYTGGTADYSTLQRIETEDAYMVLVEYDIEMDMDEFKGYDLYINDYRTGRAYEVKLNRTAEFYDSAQMLNILQSFEILNEETTKNGEVIELTGDCISGTETRYADGTSDYEIYYADPDINKTIHYRLTGVESNLVSSNWGGYCRAKRINRDENDNVVNSLCLYITIMTDETLSWVSKPDEFFNSDTAGNATYDYSKFRRVETEKDYRVYSAGTRDEFGGVENCKFYNVLIDDYATGRSFKIMLRGTPDYEHEQLLDILNSIEIVEIKNG